MDNLCGIENCLKTSVCLAICVLLAEFELDPMYSSALGHLKPGCTIKVGCAFTRRRDDFPCRPPEANYTTPNVIFYKGHWVSLPGSALRFPSTAQ